MATKAEMEALDWFLKTYEGVLPKLKAHSGTQDEDYAGIDAWLIRDDDGRQASIGIRRHGQDDTPRKFTTRIQQGNVDRNRFELAKLSAGGGPKFYLQVWEDPWGRPVECVLVHMRLLRATGCFDPARYAEFWEPEYLFKKSNTLWARMDVGRLIALSGDCVRLADVWNRSVVIDEATDLQLGMGPRQHFNFIK